MADGQGDHAEYDDIIDLAALKANQTKLQRMLGDVTKQSAATQVAIGGAAGWVTAHVSTSVGTTAAVGIGSSILLIRVAQHQGYIQVNWKKVNKQVEETRKKVQQEANKQYPRLVNELQRFVQQNMFLAGSFAGGFLIGLSF